MTSTRLNLIIAIVLALFLWSYVRIMQEAPESRRTLEDVPVELQLPSGWGAYFEGGKGTASVQLRGSSDLLEGVTRRNIRLLANLSEVKNEQTMPLSVQVTGLPAGLRSNIDSRLSVKVFKLQRKSIPVNIAFLDQPPPGTTVGEYLLMPDAVTIEGAQEAIDQVKYVVVYVDPNEPMTSERDFVPSTVDAQGNRRDDVKVLAATVKVRMTTLTGSQTTRKVAVGEPRLTNPPRGFSVRVAGIRPKEVTLSGDPALLARQPAFLECEPLDVHSVTADSARTARLRVPRGLTVVEGADVRVDLEAQALNR